MQAECIRPGRMDGASVARQAELNEVLAAVELAAAAPGQTVLIGGEPGAGTTRLAQGVTRHLRNHGCRIAVGRCDEAEHLLPYYPFLEALAAELGSRVSSSPRHHFSTRSPRMCRSRHSWAISTGRSPLRSSRCSTWLGTRFSRALILGAYRDVEVNRRHALGRTLSALGREGMLLTDHDVFEAAPYVLPYNHEQDECVSR